MDKFISKLDKMADVLVGVDNAKPSSDFDLNPDQYSFIPDQLSNAAVLVPILYGKNGLEVMFTRRSMKLRNHPGQISFPGGKEDTTDTSLQLTALREAEEEIGLNPKAVKIIGALPKHETVTSFLVHPYVGVIENGFMPNLITDEVSEVFTAPLEHLLNPSNYRIEGRVWLGQKRRYFTIPYGPYYIWGATARILRMFAEIMDDDYAT